jgi:hypothetical protein
VDPDCPASGVASAANNTIVNEVVDAAGLTLPPDVGPADVLSRQTVIVGPGFATVGLQSGIGSTKKPDRVLSGVVAWATAQLAASSNRGRIDASFFMAFEASKENNSNIAR